VPRCRRCTHVYARLPRFTVTLYIYRLIYLTPRSLRLFYPCYGCHLLRFVVRCCVDLRLYGCLPFTIAGCRSLLRLGLILPVVVRLPVVTVPYTVAGLLRLVCPFAGWFHWLARCCYALTLDAFAVDNGYVVYGYFPFTATL